MNEQALQHLKYLLTNPYTWLLLIFTICVPYVLKYMRRFYSKKLQEQIKKEEACNLELHQKPEMQRTRKNMMVGTFISFGVSVAISYFSENFLGTFEIIFVSMIGIVALYGGIVEYRVSKGKKCLKIYDKRELLTQIGIYGGLVVLLIFVIIMFDIGRIK